MKPAKNKKSVFVVVGPSVLYWSLYSASGLTQKKKVKKQAKLYCTNMYTAFQVSWCHDKGEGSETDSGERESFLALGLA